MSTEAEKVSENCSCSTRECKQRAKYWQLERHSVERIPPPRPLMPRNR